jgi:hypothetical protein
MYPSITNNSEPFKVHELTRIYRPMTGERHYLESYYKRPQAESTLRNNYTEERIKYFLQNLLKRPDTQFV